ncbi:uncharacterized protein LOC124857274 isoform X2 [Girardinichthys multiradiatus]|uniref:uncharacterized protein LOC124857274 isoform X2 n=1 Tax=Girardinichthys multiradiatus TaxID=208333 RepID=UPI001FAC0956|nr:uncharacterized protein LOC124857274 isoform X2 [Girardinichthys multiradiatus]
MSDLSDFLRGRGLPEDAISLLEEQKIDWDVIALMDDATLANYIPSYGDRIALFNFCKSKQPLSKRKQGLLQKLREKMKTKKESPKDNTSQERTRQTKKQKATRNIEIGWIHTDGKITKQGPETDFEFEVWDFKQNHLTDDTCLTIGNMYEAARLTMLRFYIATKPKVPEEDDSETSEVIFVLESSSSEINPLQTW